jgi:photosynthetic reaction center cytochrome c subunit
MQCRVSGQFDLDDKLDKPTARTMLAMTAKMTAENFAAGGEVTCWTCHRGALVPERAPK